MRGKEGEGKGKGGGVVVGVRGFWLGVCPGGCGTWLAAWVWGLG